MTHRPAATIIINMISLVSLSPTSLHFHSRSFWNKSQTLYDFIHIFQLYLKDRNFSFKNITMMSYLITQYHQFKFSWLFCRFCVCFSISIRFHIVTNRPYLEFDSNIISFFNLLIEKTKWFFVYFFPDCIFLMAFS